jgi:hypothetical protein
MDKVDFIKVYCRGCGKIQYHPVVDTRILFKDDELRCCCECDYVISRDDILQSYVAHLKKKGDLCV